MKKYYVFLILALVFSCQDNSEPEPEATIHETETAIADVEIVEIPGEEIEVTLDVIKETVLLEVEAGQSTVEKEIPIEIIIEEIPDTEVILEESPRKH